MPQVQESAAGLYEQMRKKLANVVPDVELRYKSELAYKINVIKK